MYQQHNLPNMWRFRNLRSAPGSFLPRCHRQGESPRRINPKPPDAKCFATQSACAVSLAEPLPWVALPLGAKQPRRCGRSIPRSAPNVVSVLPHAFSIPLRSSAYMPMPNVATANSALDSSEISGPETPPLRKMYGAQPTQSAGPSSKILTIKSR